ncbi:hypothetical protein [Croceicoccus sp. Ery5]|uniref:hypothetical protein n=1 Tax=Croceicoccus sp. Ery5 TaxID=1703340 RepID=UPI001E2C8727|nr:hypothetical protein [Croceicoccus sp. Ery5]
MPRMLPGNKRGNKRGRQSFEWLGSIVAEQAEKHGTSTIKLGGPPAPWRAVDEGVVAQLSDEAIVEAIHRTSLLTTPGAQSACGVLKAEQEKRASRAKVQTIRWTIATFWVAVATLIAAILVPILLDKIQ